MNYSMEMVISRIWKRY